MSNKLRFDRDGDYELEKNARSELEILRDKYAPEMNVNMDEIISNAVQLASSKPEVLSKSKDLFFDILRKNNPSLARKILEKACTRAFGKKLTKDQHDSYIGMVSKTTYTHAMAAITRQFKPERTCVWKSKYK